MTGTQAIAPRDRITFDPTPIIRAMTIKDLSLVQVAALVGNKCSGNAVWLITNAKTTRPKHLHAICKVLGVKVKDCYPLPENAK
jgi:DNA-binding Xre family transcriptional regulator